MSNTKHERRGLWGRLKTYMLTGILVTAPAFITIYIVVAMVKIIDRRVKALVPAKFHLNFEFLGIPGIGLVILIVLLILIGFITTGWFGRMLVNFSDHVMARTPVLSSVYSTLKQLFQTLLGSNTNSFRQVVYVEFPRQGCWSIGFVTGDGPEDLKVGDEEMVYVFVPTTPNPTSGFLVMLPKSQVRAAEMSVEQGFKYIVSLGIAK